MPKQQLDLFSGKQAEQPKSYFQSDREKWFSEPYPREWQGREYQRAQEFVRVSLPMILEKLRNAQSFPWLPEELRALRIIFHNRSSWLPREECTAAREAFQEELARWERIGELPDHEETDPALLTCRTEPPTQDCPKAEWEVAGIPPIADDDGFYGRSSPLPLDQDTYVLWPGTFEPRTAAPSPPKGGVRQELITSS